MSEWIRKEKETISSIIDSGLIKKIREDLQRDISGKEKKNMLSLLKSLIKNGIDGKEIEEVIEVVMKIEEEAEKKMSETEDEGEEEDWERVSEEANNVIRTWKRMKKEAMTFNGIKAEEEAKIDAKEKEIKRKQQKEKEDALRAQADANKKAIEAKEKEKEDALKELRDRKEKEMADMKKKMEDELERIKGERDKFLSQIPQSTTVRQLSSVTKRYSNQSHFTISGNLITKSGESGYYHTITFGPSMTTVFHSFLSHPNSVAFSFR